MGWTFFGGHKEGLIHVQQKDITPETRSKVFQDIVVLVVVLLVLVVVVVVVVMVVVMRVVERRQTEMGAMLTLKALKQ